MLAGLLGSHKLATIGSESTKQNVRSWMFPMFESHPQFSAPTDLGIRIWRYMDLPKFISMMDERSLYFTRSDRFTDPFEGSVPLPNVSARLKYLETNGMDDDHYREWCDSEKWRQYVAVNCWHMNEHESAAMWNLYGASGIAVQSTYERLRDSIVDTETVFIGCVEYLDYSKDQIPGGNLLAPFLFKRKSFEHERELRACIWKPPIRAGKADWTLVTIDHGCHVAVELPQLVQRIFVAPSAPQWFVRIVKSTVQKFGFDFQVLHSGLDDAPVF